MFQAGFEHKDLFASVSLDVPFTSVDHSVTLIMPHGWNRERIGRCYIMKARLLFLSRVSIFYIRLKLSPLSSSEADLLRPSVRDFQSLFVIIILARNHKGVLSDFFIFPGGH